MKPIHPILVHFPIALLVFSVIADLIGVLTHIPTLQYAGWWTLFGAAFMGIFTVAAGVYDMRRATLAEAVHKHVHRHMHVGIALLVVIIGLAFWRWTLYAADAGLPIIYLVVALLALVLAAFQGWLGGELVYTHGVSVARPASDGGEHAESETDHGGSSHSDAEKSDGHAH